MKIIKSSTISDDEDKKIINVKKIVAEMINIETGITYYNNIGNRLEHPTPNHNNYIIGDVSYDIHPNIGVIILLDRETSPGFNIYDLIISSHREKIISLSNELGSSFKLSVGNLHTTQYMCVSDDSLDTLDNIYTHYCTKIYINKILGSHKFDWFIYSINYLHVSPYYIPFINGSNIPEEMQLLSLSTIVLDNNKLLLYDGFKSPNVPLITDYKIFNNGHICDKSIIIDNISGLTLEIASHFITLKNKFKKTNINNSVFWIKWENVKPRVEKNCAMPWEIQVQQNSLGYLREIDQTTKLDTSETNDDIHQSTHDKNITYKCFMTGMPIYEDCYVLDIYEQTIKKTINSKDLDAELKLGSVLYVPPVKINANTNTNTRKIIKKSNKVDNTVKESFIIVTRVIKHDKPVHILISPYAMHYLNPLYTGAQLFEQLTQTKVIIYRTFCPYLCKDVINKLDGSDIYISMLHAFNHRIDLKITGYSSNQMYYESIFNGINYKLSKDIKFLQIFTNCSNEKILGILSH
jgi:hypothetical protein